MKFEVHWPLSETVCTPGWTVAVLAGAQVGAAAIAAATMSWGFVMQSPNVRARKNLRASPVDPGFYLARDVRAPVRHKDAARPAARGDRREDARGRRPRHVHPRPGGARVRGRV